MRKHRDEYDSPLDALIASTKRLSLKKLMESKPLEPQLI